MTGPESTDQPLAAPQVLAQKHAVDIVSFMDEPRSVRELSTKLEVPIATCYRRVDALQDVGLIEFVGKTRLSGKQSEKLYRRTVDSLSISFTVSDSEDYTVDTKEREHNRVAQPASRGVGDQVQKSESQSIPSE